MPLGASERERSQLTRAICAPANFGAWLLGGPQQKQGWDLGLDWRVGASDSPVPVPVPLSVPGRFQAKFSGLAVLNGSLE